MDCKPHRPLALLMLLLAALCGYALPGLAQPTADRAAALRAMHESLRDKLENNDFGRALPLVSLEEGTRLSGDVYAVVKRPFSTLLAGLGDAQGWCDVMILPFNTKQCAVV